MFTPDDDNFVHETCVGYDKQWLEDKTEELLNYSTPKVAREACRRTLNGHLNVNVFQIKFAIFLEK